MSLIAIAPSNCPTCGKHCDGLANATRPPRPRDLTVCVFCSDVLEFDVELRLRDADLSDLDDDTRIEIERVQTVIQRTTQRGEA